MNPAMVGALMGAGKGIAQGDDFKGIAKKAAIGGAGGYVGGKIPFGDMFGGTPLTEAVPNKLTSAAVDSIGADPSMVFNPETGNFMSKELFAQTQKDGMGLLDSAKNYITEGFEDMSAADAATLTLAGLNTIPTEQPLNTQVTPLAVSPTQYQPNLLDINIAGGNDMNENQLTEEQLRALGLLQRG